MFCFVLFKSRPVDLLKLSFYTLVLADVPARFRYDREKSDEEEADDNVDVNNNSNKERDEILGAWKKFTW